MGVWRNPHASRVWKGILFRDNLRIIGLGNKVLSFAGKGLCFFIKQGGKYKIPSGEDKEDLYEIQKNNPEHQRCGSHVHL
jgi:hypothetical protein